MTESDIEDLANRDGPKPCVVVREGVGEASVRGTRRPGY
jgi:hypothetical protein